MGGFNIKIKMNSVCIEWICCCWVGEGVKEIIWEVNIKKEFRGKDEWMDKWVDGVIVRI